MIFPENGFTFGIMLQVGGLLGTGVLWILEDPVDPCSTTSPCAGITRSAIVLMTPRS